MYPIKLFTGADKVLEHRNGVGFTKYQILSAINNLYIPLRMEAIKMTEEEKIFAQKMFDPRSQELRVIKHTAHLACQKYNMLDEFDSKRSSIIKEFIGRIGKTYFFQGPIQFNYGCHTYIGENFFANFNLLVMDDARIYIGDCVSDRMFL